MTTSRFSSLLTHVYAMVFLALGPCVAFQCVAASPAASPTATTAPKIAKVKEIMINNDAPAKATCTVVHVDNFDNQAGLQIPIDSKHLAEATASISFEPADKLQLVIGQSPSSSVASIQHAYRIDFASLPPGQVSARLAALKGLQVSITAAGATPSTQSGKFESFDTTNVTLTLTNGNTQTVALSNIEQITLTPDTLAGGTAPQYLTVKAIGGAAVPNGRVTYRFATDPWTPQYRIRLSGVSGTFEAFSTIANPVSEDISNVHLTLQKGSTLFHQTMSLKNGETAVFAINPQAGWNVAATKMQQLVFDLRTQRSGESATEALEIESPSATKALLIAGPVEIDDTTSGKTFTGNLGEPEEFLERRQPDKAFWYLPMSPVPTTSVTYEWPAFALGRFIDLAGDVLNVRPGSTTTVTAVENQTTAQTIRILPQAVKNTVVTPLPIDLNFSTTRPYRSTVTITEYNPRTSAKFNVRTMDRQLLLGLQGREPTHADLNAVINTLPAQ
jgi:hypothetical protein